MVIPVHVGFCYLFVEKYGMGVKGAAQAHNITACCTMILLFTYASFLKPIKKAWYFPRKKTFYNLKEFLMLALPGVLMLLLENTNMQIMVLLSGLFGSEDAIAAQTLVVAFGDFVIMIPYGLGLGVVTLIGNSLGSN